MRELEERAGEMSPEAKAQCEKFIKDRYARYNKRERIVDLQGGLPRKPGPPVKEMKAARTMKELKEQAGKISPEAYAQREKLLKDRTAGYKKRQREEYKIRAEERIAAKLEERAKEQANETPQQRKERERKERGRQGSEMYYARKREQERERKAEAARRAEEEEDRKKLRHALYGPNDEPWHADPGDS